MDDMKLEILSVSPVEVLDRVMVKKLVSCIFKYFGLVPDSDIAVWWLMSSPRGKIRDGRKKMSGLKD